MGTPTLGRLPECRQACLLACPSDERRPAGARGGADRRHGAVCRREEGLVRAASRHRWLHTQFAFQGRDAGVIDAQRPRGFAAGGVQPHQDPVGLLAQQIMA